MVKRKVGAILVIVGMQLLIFGVICFTMGLYTYRIRESIHIREIIIIDTRNPVYDTRKCLLQSVV